MLQLLAARSMKERAAVFFKMLHVRNSAKQWTRFYQLIGLRLFSGQVRREVTFWIG